MSKIEEKIVAEITADFKKRQEARRPVELNWRLNMNFVVGNQFAQISSKGDIEESGKEYFWQEREVYNHIAPILETRLAKLGRVKAKAQVRPATSDDEDVASASLATKLIDAVCKENDFSSQLALANSWSEITGSAFFKVTWDAEKGHALDASGEIKEGDVTITLCPPFEIFPEDIAITDIDKQSSVMHAKVLTTKEVKRIWGKDVKGGEVNVFSFDNAQVGGGFGYTASVPKIVSEKREDSVTVIEKYEAPTHEYPNGRLIIVAGDTLLYQGDMPYLNGEDGTRGYPFAKQVCIDNLTNFFGTSVVERIIPVQRAYNTVKNRKHEFMNRMAVGVMAVEDGSVDTDSLEEEGLPPGKVVVYRQGSTPPIMLSPTQVPSEFSREEEKLLNEFVMISGVSEVTTYSQVPANVASGTAISLLLEQDDTRIALTADSLRESIKRISKQVLRLYRQFAKVPRVKRITGDNGDVEIASFCAGNIDSEDIVFDTISDIEDTLSARRAMVYDLLKLGLFADENGRLNASTKARLFEILGFGNWEDGRSNDEIHRKKALKENMELEKKDVPVDVYDDHALHIAEHVRMCVSTKCVSDKVVRDRVANHIAKHTELASLAKGVENMQRQFDENADKERV
nr:MAG TPA: Portal protein [Caudoviricetes sp.]